MGNQLYSILTALLLVSLIDLSNTKPSRPRTEKQLFLPGFSLANGNNAAGNLFRQATVTRTIVRTVSTVTAVAFRTCTSSPAAAVLPCAGRRRRQAGDAPEIEPSMVVVFGTTTFRDQAVVSSLLHLGPEAEPEPGTEIPSSDGPTTLLYPSQEPGLAFDDIEVGSTTDTPGLKALEDDPEFSVNENARINFAGTTTTTVTIPVTSVATTFATGVSQTLTVIYTGCLPPSLPVTGTACM